MIGRCYEVNQVKEPTVRMPKEDWRDKVGTIVIAVVLVVLAFVIYMVVSGQWGTKRFRGIEKFRGDRIEQFEMAPMVSAAYLTERDRT